MRFLSTAALGMAMCLAVSAAIAQVAAPAGPPAAASAAGTRIALVIGNASYRHIPALATPANDASDMAAALRNIGFEVIEGIDVERPAMREKILAFTRRLDAADVALFYYSGHGVQADGKNYLLPIETRLDRAQELYIDSIELSTIMAAMQAPRRVSVVLLDASRNSPFPVRTKALRPAIGLSPVDVQSGTVIAYATGPNNVVVDVRGRNSAFTAALLKHVATPGLEFAKLMQLVRSDVNAQTRGRQIPWMHSTLPGEFFLMPQGAGGATSPAGPNSR